MNPQDRRQQDVDGPSLDFLYGPRVQLNGLSQAFLGEAPAHPLPPDVGPEAFELGGLLRI